MNGVPILLNNKAFTPFHFYSYFLSSVASFYQQFPKEKITFFLIGENEKESFLHSYYFDPITIPLFLSLADQLTKFHNEPISLELYNTHSTNKVLAFLDRSDFFKVSGNFAKPGKNILKFNKEYLGFFNLNEQRPEHKVRFYSLNEVNSSHNMINVSTAEQQRDLLIEYYTYKVKDHFEDILKEGQAEQPLNDDLVKTLLVRLFIEVGRSTTQIQAQNNNSYNHTLLKNYQNLIEQNFASIRLPKQYAALLYITPHHLNAICNDFLGVSAGNLIRERVILEAKRLLINLDLLISEIAQKLNFDDQSYFIKFFKKYEGLTPEKFRKLNTTSNENKSRKQ